MGKTTNFIVEDIDEIGANKRMTIQSLDSGKDSGQLGDSCTRRSIR